MKASSRKIRGLFGLAGKMAAYFGIEVTQIIEILGYK